MKTVSITSIMTLTAALLIVVNAGIFRRIEASSNDEGPGIRTSSIEPEILDLVPVTIDDNGGLSLPFQIYYLHYQHQQERVHSLTNSCMVSSDDFCTIVFTPTEACYVYIFHINISGHVVQLFPANSLTGNHANNANPVQAGKRYSVSTEEMAGQSRGLKEIYFLASQDHDEVLENRYQTMLLPQEQQDILRKDIERKKQQQQFREIIQRKQVSAVTPIVVTEQVVGLSDAVSIIQPQIAQALRSKPLFPLDVSSPALQLRSRDLATAPRRDPLDKMPKLTVFNLFAESSATIVPESQPLLHEYGRALQDELREAVVVIAAHTDVRESDLHGMSLARRRADAIKQFLMSAHQIADERLIVYPYGAIKPIVSNETEEGRRLNNRMELIRIQ